MLITWAGGRVGYSQGLTAGVPRALLPTVMSRAYMTGFLLLLHTPLGGALGALFAPLGRMALTNYLMATVLFVTVGRAIGLEGSAGPCGCGSAVTARWSGSGAAPRGPRSCRSARSSPGGMP